MKNLFLSFVVLLGAFSATAQTETGVVVPVVNTTNCDYFVTLYAYDPGSCAQHTVTIYVGPMSTSVAPLFVGFQYQHAHVFSTAGGASFNVMISTPDGSPNYPGTGSPACPVTGGLTEACEGGKDCNAMFVTACWTGNQSVPEILITN